MLSTDRMLEQAKARGPRWAVAGTIRRGEHRLDYADTAEMAEQIRARYEESGCYMIRVHPPIGSVDLAKLGRERGDAKRAFDEKTAILRAGVLRALEGGRAEAEIARTAGVDRMTVRKWVGKWSWTIEWRWTIDSEPMIEHFDDHIRAVDPETLAQDLIAQYNLAADQRWRIKIWNDTAEDRRREDPNEGDRMDEPEPDYVLTSASWA